MSSRSREQTVSLVLRDMVGNVRSAVKTTAMTLVVKRRPARTFFVINLRVDVAGGRLWLNGASKYFCGSETVNAKDQ